MKFAARVRLKPDTTHVASAFRRTVTICAIVVLLLAVAAKAQESPAVTSQVNAARSLAGAEWMKAADFFCSTEEQVAAMKILPSATSGDVEGQRAEPMKVFDNLYFVGQKAVTTWALTTSDGIVLIDAGYPERFDDTLVAGLKKLGLDPRRIRAALIAHEHADHFGGARLLQQRFGTAVYMSRAGWDALEPKPGASPAAGADAPPARGMVMTDGQPLTFGDTTIIPVAIPGHTAGSMGFIFQVKDGARTHMAALFGGSILNPQRRFPASLFEQYLQSIQHFADVTKRNRVDVELLNHPIMDGLFERLERLKARRPGEPHPLVVGEAAYQRFLGVMAACTRAQIARRQSAPQAARPPVPEITRITGNLYRGTASGLHNIFLVTPAGIILGDPISTPFATWLKAELAARFPVPVKYVIYSHGHYDHIEGGSVFADTAMFVAHENMRRAMDGRLPQMPGGIWDGNRNGRIEFDEASTAGRFQGYFKRLDRNGDGGVAPAEYHAEIRRPDIVYSQRMTLNLGDARVELIHPGANHSDDATIVWFPEERVVFAVDFIADGAVRDSLQSLPGAWGDFDWNPMSGWIDSMKVVEALDFDVFVAGEGNVASKADVTAMRQFFEDLRAAVSAGMSQGKSLAELQQAITLETYKGWRGYEERRLLNIEAAYNNLRLYR
jgi:metallo-beta-lactamase class B